MFVSRTLSTKVCSHEHLIQQSTWLIVIGGDDCIAIKPRSSNIFVQNATCRGGNGMAIGSLGQYLEDSTVENVVVDDVKVCLLPVDRDKEATELEPDHPME
jgi:hypothetical protein